MPLQNPLSMILEQYKLSFFQERSQFILLDEKGSLLDTDATLFEIPDGATLFEGDPFLEGLPGLLNGNDLEENEVYLPSMDIELFGKKGVFDFMFKHHEHEGNPAILWLIYDFTSHYRHVQGIQQARNDAEIENELLALKQEVLELKNRELERMQAFRMELFAKISHEFRTPVNGILGLTALLRDAELTFEQRDYLRALEACSDQLLATVNDLLDFSKIEMGKMHFESIDFNVKELINSLLISFAFTAKEKGLEIQTEFDPNMPDFITGDRLRLSQIIFNLCGNAVKFTQRGSVTLKVEVLKSQGEGVRLGFHIKDTGVGIPEQDLAHIFDPYYQAGAGIARAHGGTGLGLNIVKQLVERQGGKIYAKSKLNSGSVFSFELEYGLPIVEAKVDRRPADFKETEGLRILLIEDSIINQKVTAEILRKRNHQIWLAGTGEEGLTILEKEEIDLVITDYRLPGMDGIEILNRIRTGFIAPKNQIPVAALSGSDTIDGKLKNAEYRFDKLLVKPVSPDYLLKTIDKLVSATPQEGIAEEKLVHLDYLHEVAGNNTGLIAELIDIFMEKIPVSLRDMEQKAEMEEWRILKEIAHQTKANLRYVGIRVLADLADRIEKNVEAGKELGEIPRMISELKEGCHQAIEELKGYRETLNAS